MPKRVRAPGHLVAFPAAAFCAFSRKLSAKSYFMCGIAGFYNFDGKPADPRVLLRMTDIQRHRGPDDQGLRLFSLKQGHSVEYDRDTFPPPSPGFEGGVGFNRLSILDLSPQGHQPMANESGTVFIAFNGEVYNANDHRPMLQANGYRFRTRTDTEVLLYLYEEYGIEGCLERLNGMFAFVIVDLRSGEMHIARDHFGIKPMYYARHGNTLLFASEAKSIVAWPGFPRDIDPTMLDEYLLFRYNAGEGFLLRGIKQLRPGHRLRVKAEGEVQLHRYYELPDAPSERMTEDEALDRFSAVFEAGVERQLISDRTLGVQLSGGIDSSLVAIVAREKAGHNIEAFSIVFDDKSVSESGWIDQAAVTTGTISYKYPLTEDYFFDHLRAAAWHYDSPINLGNAVGLFMLAEKASHHVTVMLSGDSADEMMGGYPRFFLATIRPFAKPFMPVLRHLPNLGAKLDRNFDMPRQLDSASWFIKHSTAMRDWQALAVRPDADLASALSRRRSIFQEGRSTFIDNCIKYEMQTFMVELLSRQDKMTMAHSVETRVPFLDRETVAFARRVPRSLRVRGCLTGQSAVEDGTKILLKRLAERRFGKQFAQRRKMGFALPLAAYFRSDRFRDLWEGALRPGIVGRGWINAAAADGWLEQVRRTPAKSDNQPATIWASESLWSIVSLELWGQECVDASAPALHPPSRATRSR